jgi:glycosyltransferase involved in cell wall biosynthesis
MLLDNPFVADRRVQNEAASLTSDGHHVTVVAMKAADLPEVEDVGGVTVRRLIEPEIFDVKRPGYARRLARRLAGDEFDVVHCHDHWMLDLGARIKRLVPSAVLVYDSHELFGHWPLNLRVDAGFVLRLKSRLVRAYCVWRERRNAAGVDRVVTVNESVADALRRDLGLLRPPTVVRNIPPAAEVTEGDKTVRASLGIPTGQRIVVCIGARLHPRTLNLEQVMEELAGRGDVGLVLIAADHGDLQRFADNRGFRNVYFHPFVAPERVTAALSGCDVGLVPTWNKKDLSYWYALDNKLFEYIAAGLPVLATRQPEYRRVVEEYGVGVCVDPDRPGAYSEGLSAILSNLPEWRRRVLAARLELTWQKEQDRLLGFYRELAGAGS